ncbi:hypothetical protein BDF20DRAFT_847563 [Mycotypha africana]|uniref:uncharacterized protein n=1 Tax=Mycotypha africana TaxID=64632 RepID=UPI0023013274|nr:uncharacterized protein BDF20DRAFT_847563 [Mycotypha africana]KAI8991969.1 hypothetical protein BDF20DRAFT_847563 [Mycotypha africana]
MEEYVIDEIYLYELLFYNCTCKNFVIPATDFIVDNKPTFFCKKCSKSLSYSDDDLRVKYKYIKMLVKKVTTGEMKLVILPPVTLVELLGCDAKEFTKCYAEDPTLLKKIEGCLVDQFCLLEFDPEEKEDMYKPRKCSKFVVKLGNNFTNLLDYIKLVYSADFRLGENPYH